MTTTSAQDTMIIPLSVSALADNLVTLCPDRKIPVIKILRELTGLDLKESKDAIEAAHGRISAARLQSEILQAALVGDDDLLIQLAANLRQVSGLDNG